MSWRDEFGADGVWAVAEVLQERLEMAGPSRLPANDARMELLRDLVARVLAQRGDPHVAITARSLGKVASLLKGILDGFPDLAAAFTPIQPKGGAEIRLPRFEQIAEEVRSWPQSDRGQLVQLSDQVASLASAADALFDRANARVAQLEATIMSLNHEGEQAVAGRSNEMLQVVEASQARLREVQRDIDRLEGTAQQQTARIEEAIRAHQDTFAQAERQRVEQAAEASSQRVTDWSAELSSTRERVDAHLASMGEHEAQSRKVLAAVGVNSTATDYGNHANEQAKAADTWRRIAVVILSLAGAWFVASSVFPYLHGDGALWEQAVSRLGVTAAVAGVGLYAARESSQHRTQERRARRAQLVLTALEPFIANLETDRAAQIRDEAARALFVADTGSADTEVSSSDQVFTVVTEMLRKIPDSAK